MTGKLKQKLEALVRANKEKSHLPVAALLCVDVTPRWLYGHTIASKHPDAVDHDRMAQAIAHERIGYLMKHAEDRHIPCLSIDRAQLHRYRLTDFKKKGRVVVAGVYGGACVFAVAECLLVQGYSVAIIGDACLWDESFNDSKELVEETIPVIKAEDVFHDLLVDADEYAMSLWSGAPPEYE